MCGWEVEAKQILRKRQTHLGRLGSMTQWSKGFFKPPVGMAASTSLRVGSNGWFAFRFPFRHKQGKTPNKPKWLLFGGIFSWGKKTSPASKLCEAIRPKKTSSTSPHFSAPETVWRPSLSCVLNPTPHVKRVRPRVFVGNRERVATVRIFTVN